MKRHTRYMDEETRSRKKSPRPFVRVSLYTMAVGILAAGCVYAFVSLGIHSKYRRERAIAQKLEVYGAKSTFVEPYVIGLEFSGTEKRIGDSDLDEVVELAGKLSRLKYLDIADTNVTDLGISHLASLTHLERLVVNEDNVTEDGVGLLWTTNETLYVSFASIQPDGKHIVTYTIPGKIKAIR